MKPEFGFGKDVRLDSKEGALLFMALVIMLYTVLRIIAVGIHEILGHGLSVELFGGKFFATYISPSGGFALIDIPEGIGRGGIVAIFMAGIIAEIVIGLVVLFIIYPRMKTFYSGLAMLVFSEVLLVHSSFYLVLGSYIPAGDSFKAILFGRLNPSVPIILGLLLVGVFIMLISVRVLKFLSRHISLSDNRKGLKILVLFWLPALLIIWLSIAMPSETVAGGNYYAVVYGLLFTMMVFSCVYYISRLSLLEFDVSEENSIEIRKVVYTLAVFVVALSVWLAVFGPSPAAARGVQVSEAPTDVEWNSNFHDYSIGNLDIFIGSNNTVTATLSLRLIMDYSEHSPLEQGIYESFALRPHWPNYIEASRIMVKNMAALNRTEADTLNFTTELNGTVWANDGQGGAEYEYARVCRTTFEFYLMEVENDTDEIVLSLIDPWMTGPTPGYIDQMTIRWDPGLVLHNYSSQGIEYNFGNEAQNIIGWQNMAMEVSPNMYTVTLRRAGPI